MVKTHLDPNTEVHQTHLNEVAGLIEGLEGNNPQSDLYITPRGWIWI